MDSRIEIDFMDLNTRPQSEMAKQHTKGMKWPFSSMANNLATQAESRFFQNYNSSPIVSSNSKSSPLKNYKFTTKDSRKNSEHLRKPESTLTILYMGEVHIFQDITPEKAEVIMDLASKSTTLHMTEISEMANKEKYEENKSEPSTPNASTNYAKGALAMARRATLARFLEKRKHRLITARPYQYGEKTPKFPFEMHQEEETASSSFHWES
ncbi:protein JAZ7-like [Nicotiana tabacum]|uniref:Protein JAZ7-like n=3 Tax=Nicotiana TaxID=4085 RepID=A0AC58SI33_TOBAC